MPNVFVIYSSKRFSAVCQSIFGLQYTNVFWHSQYLFIYIISSQLFLLYHHMTRMNPTMMGTLDTLAVLAAVPSAAAGLVDLVDGQADGQEDGPDLAAATNQRRSLPTLFKRLGGSGSGHCKNQPFRNYLAYLI